MSLQAASWDEIVPGAHVCPIIDSLAEQNALLVPAIRAGLAAGEQVRIAASEATRQELAQSLIAAGVDVEGEQRRGALQFVLQPHAIWQSSDFDPAVLIEHLRELHAAARRAGFTRLRLIGEMHWLLPRGFASDRLFEYEARLTRLVSETGVAATCSYLRERFDPALLHDVLRCHPQAAVAGRWLPNPYFEPPELLLATAQRSSPEFKRLRAAWWFDRLQAAARADMERVRAIEEAERQAAARRQSEEHNRQVVESIPQMLWTTRGDGHADFLNSRAVEYLGETAEKCEGWDWLQFLHPDDVDGVRRAWQHAVQTGENYRTEYRIRGADGLYRWYLSQGVPLRGPDGAIEKWIGAWTDIDKLKRAEQALAHDALLLSNVRDAIVATDMAGIVTDWNAGAERLFGWKAEEMLGRPLIERFPEAARAPVAELTAQIAAGTDFDGEFEDYRKDGSRVWIEARVTRFLDAQGQPAGLLGLSQDITRRKQAERERDRLLSQMQRQIESMPLACVLLDEQMQVADWNPAAERIFGYTKNEMLHMSPPYERLVPPSAQSVVESTVNDVQSSGQTVCATNENLTKDGRTIVCRWYNTPLINDEGAVHGMVCLAEDVTAHRTAEDALRLRDRAIQAVTQGILITDPRLPDNPIIYASASFERLTGFSSQEILGRNCRFLQGKDTDPAAVAEVREAIAAARPCTVEILNYRKDGSPFWNELFISPVFDEAGELTHFVGVQADVTVRRTLEEQLRQAQKMEAIGRLAGGVAHDFNNLLTVISGYSDVLLEALPPDDPNRDLVDEIKKAGDRSAALTRQLLVFSRKQVLAPRVLNLNDVVLDTERMLRRIIGEDVELGTSLHPRLHYVAADAGQIEQILLNLALNSRDAMPRGGRLTIETNNVRLARSASAPLGESPPAATSASPPSPAVLRDYVMLAVSDTGVGMSPDVKRRVFEPFFTTKEPGRGTGLGLAVVHGAVEQSGGHIQIESQVGEGATVRIFLPAVDRNQKTSRADAAAPAEFRGGGETVLLVEDEEPVRALAQLILQRAGYRVLPAANGDVALEIVAAHSGPIHLLLTDVVMPGMGGRQLAERLVPHQAGMKVLYISGYTDDAVVRYGVLQDSVEFLQKPFSPQTLLQKVRDVLNK